MIDINKIRKNVKKYLDEKRYNHVERVVKCAVELAETYNVDVEIYRCASWICRS